MFRNSAIGASIGGIIERVRQRSTGMDLDEDDVLTGRTCLVTGANRGLGLAVARGLSDRGGLVIAANRSGGPEAARDIATTARAMPLDLGDLDSVDQLARDLDGRTVDVLVLNAGVVPREARRTRHGFDESFQVNFLANVLLVRRLEQHGVLAGSHCDEPQPSADLPRSNHMPRIVMVGSESHRGAPPVIWDRLGEYQPWGLRDAVEEYGKSKLLLQIYADELARRREGRIAVHSLCPGAVHTDIGREAPSWAKPMLDVTMRAFFKSPEDAAIPVVYLACARALENQSRVYLHATRRRDPSDEARNSDNGTRLWQRADELLAAAGYG